MFKLLHCIMFLAKLNIGHNKTESSSNRGHFLEFVHHLAIHFLKNDYELTAPTFLQNELMHYWQMMLLKEFVKK